MWLLSSKFYDNVLKSLLFFRIFAITVWCIKTLVVDFQLIGSQEEKQTLHLWGSIVSLLFLYHA